MATASCDLSEEQFLCSICLDVFTDPVTTPCGHTFCKQCIDRNWVNTAVYKCPYCNQQSALKPELKVNIFISEMTQQFRERARASAQTAAAPGDVVCDLCPRTKALKSCLVCLSSYCESHLQPHLRAPGLRRHQLVEPVKDLTERVCEEHDKPLELYCPRDHCCVCVLCLLSTHKDHQAVPLKSGCEERLKGAKETIKWVITEHEQKIQQLRSRVEYSNDNADREYANGVKILMALKESVERSVAKLTRDINKRRSATEQAATHLITEIKQDISELQKWRTDLDQLAQTDHFHAIKDMSKVFDYDESVLGDVDVCVPDYRAAVVRAVSELEHELSKPIRKLLDLDLEWKKIDCMRFVLLDASTAHPQLTVSEDGTEVQHSPEKNPVPDSPGRFDEGLYVLGTRKLSGHFYFEVVVGLKSLWTVGVARKSVSRKGDVVLAPENGFWTLTFDGRRIYASGAVVVSHIGHRYGTVGVFVDSRDGVVSFYDVEGQSVIYSYTECSFGEKLYPIFSPGQYDDWTNKYPLVMNKAFEDDD